MERGAAAGGTGTVVGAAGDQTVDLGPVPGDSGCNVDELRPVTELEPSVHAFGVDRSSSPAANGLRLICSSRTLYGLKVFNIPNATSISTENSLISLSPLRTVLLWNRKCHS